MFDLLHAHIGRELSDCNGMLYAVVSKARPAGRQASARGSLAKNRNSKRPFSTGFNPCERIQSTCVRRTLLRVGRETYCGMDRSGAPCLCFAPR